MKVLLALIVLVSILVASFLNWRSAVKAVFFILVIEGALRKWMLPQASDLIYFLKDFVLLGAYIKYYGFYRGSKKYLFKNKVINIFIYLAAGWCIFQALNPSLGSVVAGIFGLKIYLFYIPLVWMLPNLFETEEDLYKFLRSHFLLIILTGTIGIIQFYSPASSPINAYAGDTDVQVATFGFGANSAVRVSGTFSYINSYSGYLFACFGLLIPMISLKQPKLWQCLTIVELFLVILNSIMNGSRTVTFASILFILGFISIRGTNQPISTLRWLSKFIIPVLLVILVASLWFAPVIDQFSRRVNKNQDVSGRISSSLTEPINFLKYKNIDGFGTGATHPGTQALRITLNLPQGEVVPQVYEAEMGRILLEIGPIGFILWYILRIAIAINLLQLFWNLKRPFLRQLALAGCLIQTIWISGQLVFHHTFSIYYWLISSFIFLLPKIEQMTNWQEQLQGWSVNVQTPYFPDSSNGQSQLP